MTFIPNTDYVYEYAGDLFLTHHSDNYKLSDIQKLTCIDPSKHCTIWVYNPTASSHQTMKFYNADEYKSQYPEAFI